MHPVLQPGGEYYRTNQSRKMIYPMNTNSDQLLNNVDDRTPSDGGTGGRRRSPSDGGTGGRRRSPSDGGTGGR